MVNFEQRNRGRGHVLAIVLLWKQSLKSDGFCLASFDSL
jgi:hypothetical protein